jgi:parvulin-like peptidyl-prolyl isomerase
MKACLILAMACALWAPSQGALAGHKEISEQAGELQDPSPAARAGLEVIARVNGDPVTRAQYDQMVGNPITLRQARRELGVEEPDRKELERVAMKRLVHLCLLVQEARRKNIRLSQEELDQTVSEISHRFESLKDLGEWMKDQGLNDPWLFGTVHTDLLAERARTELAKEVTISDQEAQEYFEAHKEDLILGAEVRLRIIAVRSKPEADEVLAALRKGTPFDRLARSRSVGKLAARGGDTGWVNFGALPALLQEAVTELKPREVCGPVEKSKDEFLIVALQDRRPILPKTLADARGEIEQRLLPEKQREFLETWLQQQEGKSKVEILLQGGELWAAAPQTRSKNRD